jgi:hypothetical protein
MRCAYIVTDSTAGLPAEISCTQKEENMVTNDCPFLERLRRPQIGGIYGCSAGINFYPVGQDRERCQVCTIAFLGRLPDCQYLDVHAFLNIQQGQPLSVEVQPYCTRLGYLSSDLHRCARCPERLSRPVLAPTPAR